MNLIYKVEISTNKAATEVCSMLIVYWDRNILLYNHHQKSESIQDLIFPFELEKVIQTGVRLRFNDMKLINCTNKPKYLFNPRKDFVQVCCVERYSSKSLHTNSTKESWSCICRADYVNSP